VLILLFESGLADEMMSKDASADIPGHEGLRHPHHELRRMALLKLRKKLHGAGDNGEVIVAWTGVKTGRCSKCGDVCPGDTKRVNVGKRYAELCGSCRRVRSNLRNVGLIG
jgi:hypothetical protein